MVYSVHMSPSFQFEEIGLENRDKRVYEALLASPQASLRKLAELTGINRGSVYESVKKLAEQGLVGSIAVGKQRRYTATEPHAIIELLKERQQQAAAAQQAAAQYIATLSAVKPAAAESVSFATFYQDHEGIAAILRDVIATCRELPVASYRVISTRRVRQYMYQNFPNFTQRRIAEGISVRVIGVDASVGSDELSERRGLSATRGGGLNCYTLMYGQKTALITIGDANLLAGIVIDNAGITQLQKELFDQLWDTLA